VNKLLVFVGIAFLLIAFIGTAESYSFSKQVSFNKEIFIVIDDNTVTITADNFNWSRSCQGSYITTLNVPLTVDINEDYCPTLNEVYNPLLEAYKQCDMNAIKELKDARADLNEMLKRIDYNAMHSLLIAFGQDQNKLIQQYLSAHDTMLSNKMNDWWAKIEKTLMPSQATLRTLEVQRDECEKLRKSCIADLNNAKFETTLLRGDIIPAKDAEIQFWRTICYILIILVLGVLAYEFGVFDKFLER